MNAGILIMMQQLRLMMWDGVVVVAHAILVSAQGPLVFVFLCLGIRGLGPGLDNCSASSRWQNIHPYPETPAYKRVLYNAVDFG